MLEAVGKALLFSKKVVDLKLERAEFIGGVYKIDLSGIELPEKPFVEDIVQEHMLCKDLVESILERDPACRDDDARLIFRVWAVQGIDIDLDAVELAVMFSSESIRRSRQKIQNTEAKFLPTTFAVAKRRRINEELLREHYGRGELI